MMKHTKRRSISMKLMISFGALIVVICAMLSLVSMNMARIVLLQKEKKSMQEQVDLIAMRVEQKLNDNLSLMQSLARRSEFNDPQLTAKDLSELCAEEADAGEFYTLLYVLPNGNTILPGAGIELNLLETGDEAFQKALETGESSYKNTVTKNGTSLMVTAAVPIKNEGGTVTGVLVSTISIDDFAAMLGTDIEAFIIDSEGNYIGHTHAAEFVKDENGDAIANEDGSLLTEDGGINISVNALAKAQNDASYQGLAKLMTDMILKGVGVEEYRSMETGEMQFAAYSTVATTDWRVVYLVDKDIVMSSVNEMIGSGVVASAIAIVIGVMFTYVISKGLLKPMVKATDDLEVIISNIQAGEGDLTARVETKSNDEIGRIIAGIGDSIQCTGYRHFRYHGRTCG